MPKHPWKLDNKLTAMMVDDLVHDPVLAAKVILGIKIPPHQEIRLNWMWTTYYTQDDSGFSTGKSYTLAIVMALRSVLFQNRIGGIVSGTFRQGKLIFANMERWAHSSKIFRSCVKTDRGRIKFVHNTEAWEASFRGNSVVRVLPPNFAQDADRLKSERWHDGYFDEWVMFNIKAMTKTLFGRVTAMNKNQECPIKQNHIHLCGTPGFKHDPPYRLVKQLQRNIASGDRNYGQFTSNYRHVPKTERWKGFVDRKMIFTMQTMNPPGIVRSEIDGLWQEGSLSFYDSLSIHQARNNNIRIVKARDNDRDTYVAGFDSARGAATGGKGDDFAISVLRIPSIDDAPQHAFTYRANNVTAAQMAAAVQYTRQNFGLSYTVYDPLGGSVFVKDELKKTALVIGDKLETVTPMIEMGDPHITTGDPILIPFKRNCFHIDRIWGKMASDSVLLNRLHRETSSAISSGNLLLAPVWNGWDIIGSHWDVDAKRDWLNRNKGLSFVEKTKAEMDLAVTQLILVDVARDQEGNPKVDTNGMFKFGSRFKKDAAYSLIYAYMAYMIWKMMVTIGLDFDGDEEDPVIQIGAI